MFNNTKRFFVKNFQAGEILEDFLISAVASVLVIRFFLIIFNYPQIGGNGLHIAHMLWGGLLMMAAMVLMICYLTQKIRHLAAVIGGIGFGFFIDELGKFITSDNNYFFQPAMALIYIIFILLFLFFRYLGNNKKAQPNDYLVNALELTKESIINDLDDDEKTMALEYLKFIPYSRFSEVFNQIFIQAKTITPPKPIFIKKLYQNIKINYKILVTKKWFLFFLLGILLLLSTNIVSIIILLFNKKTYLGEIGLSLSSKLEILFSIISSLLALGGIFVFIKNRPAGYKILKYSVLVSIFLTQVFAFYTDQLLAIGGLSINIIMLITLNYLIFLEESSS